MSDELEQRVRELEARLRALMSLVLSDIGSTQADGTRDITTMITIAEGEMAAAAKSSIPESSVILDDLIGEVRAVLDLPAPIDD